MRKILRKLSDANVETVKNKPSGFVMVVVERFCGDNLVVPNFHVAEMPAQMGSKINDERLV